MGEDGWATACNVLRGFVNQVTDEAGDGLTVDLAGVFVERANRIRAVIGCA
jgi:hypothetical protein